MFVSNHQVSAADCSFSCSFPFLWSPSPTHRAQLMQRISRNKRRPTESCIFHINIHGKAIHLQEFNIRQSSRVHSFACLLLSSRYPLRSHCVRNQIFGMPYKCTACKNNKVKKKSEKNRKGDRAADSTAKPVSQS